MNLSTVETSIISATTCGRTLKKRNEERRYPYRSRTVPVRFGYD
jgi:hypothetical protein